MVWSVGAITATGAMRRDVARSARRVARRGPSATRWATPPRARQATRRPRRRRRPCRLRERGAGEVKGGGGSTEVAPRRVRGSGSGDGDLACPRSPLGGVPISRQRHLGTPPKANGQYSGAEAFGAMQRLPIRKRSAVDRDADTGLRRQFPFARTANFRPQLSDSSRIRAAQALQVFKRIEKSQSPASKFLE